MTHDPWTRVDRLFEAALDRPPSERDVFLRDACAGDARLYEEVASLLAASQATGAFLERGAGELAAELLSEIASEALEDGTWSPGSLVGAYRVLRPVARGGMGTVYEAERADGAFEQRAALKVLRRGLDTEDVLRRFLAERQILAAFDHPNIARLLDGGETEDGRPYLVMEYVEGRPIDVYCEQEALTVDQRLDLFLTVADAVQYAHGRLVIHRDLKPSNILVTDEGEVRLLDFGIAKLLDESDLGTLTPKTRTGVHLLTPAFASPEQMRGAPVTTASDVYQLGAVLFRMLTGRDACPEPDAASLESLTRSVLEAEPPRPSAVVEARSLRNRLRGDLDTIVLRALSRDPARRYASAERLAADIERHRAGRPIAARADTLRYRAGKFVRRHPISIAAAVIVSLLAGAYLVTLNVYADRLEEERNAARVAAARAAQTTDFLIDLFEVVDPDVSGGETVTARQLLDHGAERVDRLGDQPELQALMLTTMARAYRSINARDPARAMGERALEIQERLHGGDHPDIVQTLRVLRGLSLPDSALSLSERALKMAERVHGPDAPAVAEILADMLTISGLDRELKAPLARRALVIGERAGPEGRELLARTLMVSTHGRSDLPRDTLTRRLEHAIELFRDLGMQNMVAEAMSDMALVLERKGAAGDTLDALLERAITLHADAMGEKHLTTLLLMNNWAAILRDRGDWAAAEELYREVLRLREEFYPDDRRGQAYARYGLGRVLIAQGEATEAEAVLREAESAFDPADSRGLRIRLEHARAVTALGRYRAAERLLDRVSAVVESRPGELDWLRPTVIDALVEVYDRWGRPAEATEYRRMLAGLDDV